MAALSGVVFPLGGIVLEVPGHDQRHIFPYIVGEDENMTMSFPTRSRRFCRLNDLTMSTASSSTSAREICSCHDEVVQPAKQRRSSSAAGPVAPKPSRDTEAQDLQGGAAEATANCGKNLVGECSNKVWRRSGADAVSCTSHTDDGGCYNHWAALHRCEPGRNDPLQPSDLPIRQPNADNGVLQLTRCLDIVPRLETLHLDMVYLNLDDGGSDEVVEEEGSHMSHHGHLRTVYMSGFRCYNDQVKLAYCILQNARVLEHMEIQPRVAAGMVAFQ
uniref:FBD domain-containing protein n=1 Tax=Aegilops tauschii TaxID=37682 RepID=M8C2Q7_AEGTA